MYRCSCTTAQGMLGRVGATAEGLETKSGAVPGPARGVPLLHVQTLDFEISLFCFLFFIVRRSEAGRDCGCERRSHLRVEAVAPVDIGSRGLSVLIATPKRALTQSKGDDEGEADKRNTGPSGRVCGEKPMWNSVRLAAARQCRGARRDMRGPPNRRIAWMGNHSSELLGCWAAAVIARVDALDGQSRAASCSALIASEMQRGAAHGIAWHGKARPGQAMQCKLGDLTSERGAIGSSASAS